ncbi:hypothetical protein, partial [Lentilactobacillus parabuchneri]|uniref:hypothetical protein n=1 Tax=Lentilactobacillus parabuchneri TaxID=152331 RepID=UPI00195DF3FA
LAKMMANLTHVFGWIEKLSRIFQRKWKMRLSLFIGGTYVPASRFPVSGYHLIKIRDNPLIQKDILFHHTHPN